MFRKPTYEELEQKVKELEKEALGHKGETKNKVRCWEVFRCDKKECPVYESRALNCWLMSGTHCRHEIQGKFLEKIEMCLECAPFQANIDTRSVRETLKAVNKQLTEFRHMVEERDMELEGTSMELALGLSEVFEALQKISSGDPEVRIPEASQLDLIAKLKHMVNRTAENLGDIVGLSHEFAIGLAEHFDVLDRVSKNDLSARISGVSKVDLLESLKNVTNHMIDSISRGITKRQQVEEKYRVLFEGSAEGILVADIETKRLILANPAICRMLGYNEEELKGMCVSDIHPEEALPRTISEFEAQARGEKTLASNIACLRKDGTIIYTDINTALISMQGRQCNIGFFTDVTQRWRTEEALRETQGLATAIVENVLTGIVVIDAETHIIVDVNAFATKLIGASREEILGHVCHMFICPAEEGKCPVTDLGQTVNNSEQVLINFKGEQIPVLKTVTPVMLKGRQHLIDSFVDISHIKRMEEKTRESEERFRAISDSAQDALIMMDDKGHISYWNRAAEQIFGWSSQETLGKNLHELLAPEKYHSVSRKGLEQFRRSGKGPAVGKTLELSAVRKDGTEFPMEISLAGMNLKGKWYAVGIVRDITDRKRTERELQEAKEAAEVANIAKSQFLANMSHEIRTPMNGVIGMTGLLLDTELTREQRQYAETVINSGHALLEVINEILDFSKIEAGKLDLENIDFDLRTTLEDTAEALAVMAHQKGLEFACLVDHEVPALVRSDPGRLRQVLTNLAGNAIKFTEKGEVVIRVTVEKEDDAHVILRFSVTDTGIGVPTDRTDCLFQSFSQADSSHTRKYGGTGLGLSISKQLSEMMGGQIGVESEEGKGSTFWFTAVLEKQPEGLEVEMVIPEDVREKRILVVDDNETNRLVLKEQLKSWGCCFDEASNGAEALDKLRKAVTEEKPFDIAFVDMGMPEMDGETLGRKIKEDPDLKTTILVMLSSAGQRGDAQRAKEIGFAAYLTKPVRRSELYHCLATVTGRQTPTKDRPLASIMTRHTIAEDQKRRLRILLAEDNTTNQQVALAILKKLGFRADAVANGKEAIQALEMIPYDLVLMDVQMPEMDGLEATSQIRNLQSPVRNHDIPIIAMTAYALKGDREKCLEGGMDDYVSKPVEPQELIEAIERQIAGSAQAAESTATVKKARPEKEAFKRSALLDRLDGDEELFKQVIAVFIKDIPDQLEELKQGLSDKNAEVVERKAHRIKGASANVGAQALSDVALEAEMAGREGNLDRAAPLVENLEQAFERLREVLSGSDLT
jgi:two-component system sensor histidine kinase/response regulator